MTGSSNFANNTKTAALMAGLMALFGAAAWLISGNMTVVIIALMFGGLMNIIAFFNSDKIAIATMRGQAIDPSDTRLIAGSSLSQADIHRMTEDMARAAGLPVTPRLYICPHQAPNAFATGRSPSKSAVAVTVGLLQHMSEDEVRGVIAHELAHVKHRDTLISTLAGVMAGTLAVLAQMAMWTMLMGGGRRDNPLGLIGVLAAVILAPIAASVIQMAISRSREFAADREGAVIAGSPRGLMSALAKLDRLSREIPLQQPNPAQNNMFIVEPLAGGKTLTKLFATHPPTEDRIEALRQLEL